MGNCGSIPWWEELIFFSIQLPTHLSGSAQLNFLNDLSRRKCLLRFSSKWQLGKFILWSPHLTPSLSLVSVQSRFLHFRGHGCFRPSVEFITGVYISPSSSHLQSPQQASYSSTDYQHPILTPEALISSYSLQKLQFCVHRLWTSSIMNSSCTLVLQRIHLWAHSLKGVGQQPQCASHRSFILS